jgi:DNA gyrase subunit A
VLTHNVTDRTGRVVAARAVLSDYELILVSQSGIVMRTTVESISKVGRSAQGVHVMNVGPGDKVASVAVIALSAEPPEPPATNGTNGFTPQSNGGPPPANGNGRRRRR